MWRSPSGLEVLDFKRNHDLYYLNRDELGIVNEEPIGKWPLQTTGDQQVGLSRVPEFGTDDDCDLVFMKNF